MATKTRKKSTAKRKAITNRPSVRKHKKRSVRSKKGFLDKLLAIFD